MSEKTDTFGYEKKTLPELRKILSDLYRDNLDMKDKKKAFVDGVNEVVKGNNERMEIIINFITLAERAGADADHERRVEEFLASRNQQAN